MMNKLLSVGFGSAFGGVFQYMVLSFFINIKFISPLLTLIIINLTGSFLLGFLLFHLNLKYKKKLNLVFYFWAVGFCGGFTTFGSFINVLSDLININNLNHALFFSFTSVFGGMLFFLIGFLIRKNIFKNL